VQVCWQGEAPVNTFKVMHLFRDYTQTKGYKDIKSRILNPLIPSTKKMQDFLNPWYIINLTKAFVCRPH